MTTRIGTMQRNEVLHLLGQALEEGYLDLDEYEQRMTAVTAAKTADQLMEQVTDLPHQFQWSPQRPAGVASPSRSAHSAHVTSIASLVLAIVSLPLAVCFGIGGLFGIAAIVLSRPGLRTKDDYGKALTGFVGGCLGVLLSLGMILLYIFVPV
jgi:hypothetical protein